MSLSPTAAEIEQACICLGVRRAARAVARRYDDALRPLAITSGQFSILAALSGDQAMSLGALAEALGLERTTLNRNLRPLEAAHLVESQRDADDARVRGLRLTPAGRALLGEALPIWRSAQIESQRRLGENDWPALRTQLQSLG